MGQASRRGAVRAAALVGVCLMLACSGGAGGDRTDLPAEATFVVTDGNGDPIVAATVYLVPAGDVDGSAITGTDVRSGAAEDRDEPLEDAVRNNGAGYLRGMTGADGSVTIGNVGAGRFFWFVQPGAADLEHLPGGDGCRTSRRSTTFRGLTSSIRLSSRPSASATYTGSSSCLTCHPAFADHAQHAHRLAFTVPGQLAPQQDDSRYPDYRAGWGRFIRGTSPSDGTAVYFSDFDVTRGVDKFKTSLTDPRPGETVYIIARLWRDANDGDRFKITLENVINPADPGSPRTLDVPLTYGGAVLKQRHLVRIPGRRGLYPFLQYQTEGDDLQFDRTRRVYRDYRGDWFWDDPSQQLVDPPLNTNFDANCTACHSTGFRRFSDPATGELLTDAVDDPGGAFDIDGNGMPDEINLGCEVCHGPGSEHAAWAADPTNAGRERRFIVEPRYLSPSREMMVCGRCHDRVQGMGPIANEEPLDAQGRTAPVGISRHDFLAGYASRKGPEAGDYWSDDIHSRRNHQHYSDLLKSTMHRNDRILTTCTDCHDSHGFAPFRNHLVKDPLDPNGPLCLQCHDTVLFPHMLQRTSSTHAGNATTCANCHMTEAAKTGAGRFGALLGAPTGGPGDVDVTYFENDLSSHLFLAVPDKFHPDVAGRVPATAMPIPYTRSCGVLCHGVFNLPFLPPAPLRASGTDPLEPGRPPAAGDDDR